MEADDAALRAYYERGMERERLSDGRGDLDARMADPVDRSVALEVSRAIERVPELVGFGRISSPSASGLRR